jgi:hypothetical protein
VIPSHRTAVFIAALALLGCTPEDVVVGTLAADAAPDDAPMQDEPPPGNGSCTTNDDCGETWFCEKSRCGDAVGSCVARPIECDGMDDWHCGCDGVTYWNDCLRKQYGIASSTPDQCSVGAAMCSPQGPSCPVAGASCERLIPPEGVCDPNVPGVCWVVPSLPTMCSGPSGGPPILWAPCDGSGGPPMCADTCAAIRSGMPYQHPSDPDECQGQ